VYRRRPRHSFTGRKSELIERTAQRKTREQGLLCVSAVGAFLRCFHAREITLASQ
jgi:hypothetical protein